MIESTVKAMLAVSAIVGGWLAVQLLWARATGAARGQDPLAGRLGCHGCHCRTRCEQEEQTDQ
jgi:hypothetical protein